MIENAQSLPNNQNGRQSFLLIDTRKYSFQKTFQKILGYSPMFNNTCVVLAIQSHRVECVAHISSDGKILRSLTFQNKDFYPYAIPSDREIMWLDADNDLILQWNLDTYVLSQFPFSFLNDQISETRQLFIFPENKLLCIAEWGNHSSNKFRLTYLKYPLQAEAEPVNVFDRDDCWTYECAVRRGNTSSMIIWFKSFHKQHIEFNTYELVMQNNQFTGKRKNHRMANPIMRENMKAQLSVGNIWQMTPNKYMVVSITDRPKQDGSYPNSLFVYEELTNVFRESRIQTACPYRVKNIDWCSFGTSAMIRTFDFNEAKAVETPIYYIDNAEECISAKQTWKCSYRNKYTFPGYDPNTIVDAEYQNGQVKQISSRSISVANTVQIYASMLDQLIQGAIIDEDLLYEAVHLLAINK